MRLGRDSGQVLVVLDFMKAGNSAATLPKRLVCASKPACLAGRGCQCSANDVRGLLVGAVLLIARSTTNNCWLAGVRRLDRGSALG